jgi:hypothetical protein
MIEENIIQEILTSDKEEVTEYIAIPSEYYHYFKENVDSIKDDELRQSMQEIVLELDYLSNEDDTKKMIYIPIVCEMIIIIAGIITLLAFVGYIDQYGKIPNAVMTILFFLFQNLCFGPFKPY